MTNDVALPLSRRKAVKSRVAWGAIFAGTLVSLALFLVLGSLSAAIDLTLTTKGSEVAPLFVAVLSFIAMFTGGWTTSRLAAGESTGEALFFGIILWSVTALLLLYLAINGILILGSATLLGQAGGEDMLPITRIAAWWGFAGVLLSLVATLAGVVAGFPNRTRLKTRLSADLPSRATRRASIEAPSV